MDVKQAREIKNKSGKLIRALNLYDNMTDELYLDFYECELCEGGGDYEKALEFHIKNCKHSPII